MKVIRNHTHIFFQLYLPTFLILGAVFVFQSHELIGYQVILGLSMVLAVVMRLLSMSSQSIKAFFPAVKLANSTWKSMSLQAGWLFCFLIWTVSSSAVIGHYVGITLHNPRAFSDQSLLDSVFNYIFFPFFGLLFFSLILQRYRGGAQMLLSDWVRPIIPSTPRDDICEMINAYVRHYVVLGISWFITSMILALLLFVCLMTAIPMYIQMTTPVLITCLLLGYLVISRWWNKILRWLVDQQLPLLIVVFFFVLLTAGYCWMMREFFVSRSIHMQIPMLLTPTRVNKIHVLSYFHMFIWLTQLVAAPILSVILMQLARTWQFSKFVGFHLVLTVLFAVIFLPKLLQLSLVTNAVLMLVTSLCMLFFFQRRYIHVISRATFSNSLLNKKRSPYSYLRTVFQHVVILVTFFLFLGVQALGYVFWVILMPPIWLFMISLLKKSMPQTDASSLTI